MHDVSQGQRQRGTDNIVHVNGNRSVLLSVFKKRFDLGRSTPSAASRACCRSSASPSGRADITDRRSIDIRAPPRFREVIREGVIAAAHSFDDLLFLGSWR